MRIYIGNLNYRLRTEELKNEFLPYGEVLGAKIVRDQETKRSKGFGFVEMVNDADGLRAIEALNGHELKGRKMIVTQAKPRESQDGIAESNNNDN
ncbi:MAG: RNA-binding protein [Bacteroidetes bacterium]|nr:RNA-binding protein [Bacteroidota bacterium]